MKNYHIVKTAFMDLFERLVEPKDAIRTMTSASLDEKELLKSFRVIEYSLKNYYLDYAAWFTPLRKADRKIPDMDNFVVYRELSKYEDLRKAANE